MAYAFGSVGTGVFATVPGLVLAYYLTNTLGVAAGVAAFVVAVPKAWDVIVLPIVGRFSDRAAANVGSRLPFLKLAGILLPLSFVLIFAVPPALGAWGAAAWVFLTFIVASTAFALFQVPYIALSAELTDEPEERSTLMAWRVAFLTVAILLGGALAPVIRDALGGAYLGHFVMGLFMAGLMLAGIWLCIIGLSKAPARVAPAAEGSLVDQLKVVRHNRAFVALLIGFVIQALGFAAMLGAAQYYATYIVGRPTVDHDPVRLPGRAGHRRDAAVELDRPSVRQDAGIPGSKWGLPGRRGDPVPRRAGHEPRDCSAWPSRSAASPTAAARCSRWR